MMRRLVLTGGMLALMAAGSWAAHGPEVLRGDAAAAFGSLARVHPKFQPRTWLRLVQPGRSSQSVSGKETRWIRLRGLVRLQGSGFLPTHPGYVTVTLSGQTQLRDETGTLFNGSIRVSDTRAYFVSGDIVTGYAYPVTRVDVYSQGSYLGSITIRGSIYVSGPRNEDWVHLSGFGEMSGEGYINEP